MKTPDFIRGCGDMRHVGPHPGTSWLITFVLIGAIAGGRRGSLLDAVLGALFMLAFMLPLYLIGAAERARLSDELSAREME